MKGRVISLISVVAVLALWEVTVDRGWINSYVLAAPSAIVAAGWDMFFVSRTIYPHLLASLQQAGLGFALAILTGVPLGLLMGRFAAVRAFIEPWAMAMYSTPAVALFPLLIIWLGFGLWPKVALIFLSSVFVILINTQAGVENANKKLIETARAFTATEPEIFFSILLPAATPFIVAGIRLAIGRVLITVFVADAFAANKGIGYLIVQAGANFDTPVLFMGILTLTLTGVILAQLLRQIELTLLARFREQ